MNGWSCRWLRFRLTRRVTFSRLLLPFIVLHSISDDAECFPARSNIFAYSLIPVTGSFLLRKSSFRPSCNIIFADDVGISSANSSKQGMRKHLKLVFFVVMVRYYFVVRLLEEFCIPPHGLITCLAKNHPQLSVSRGVSRIRWEEFG